MQQTFAMLQSLILSTKNSTDSARHISFHAVTQSVTTPPAGIDIGDLIYIKYLFVYLASFFSFSKFKKIGESAGELVNNPRKVLMRPLIITTVLQVITIVCMMIAEQANTLALRTSSDQNTLTGLSLTLLVLV